MEEEDIVILSENHTEKNKTIPNSLRTGRKGFDKNKLISASRTRNYLLNNQLDDWLDLYYKTPISSRIGRNNTSSIGEEYSFHKYLMNKGNLFEDKIITLIKKKVKRNQFIKICDNIADLHNNISQYEASTIKAIKKGIPIIYQALMINKSGDLNGSYGIADLLVRNDYLGSILKVNPLDDDENEDYKIMRGLNSKKNKYYYVVIDIKYTTLELCSDGKRIRNSGSFPAYKSQLCIYNQALGSYQGYTPSHAYILGRKWKMEKNGISTMGNNCFDRLGWINYGNWDKEYMDKTIKALAWVREVRTKGSEWVLYPKPSHPGLYPNISNNIDGSWTDFKHKYAREIGDVTLLWNCGPKNRIKAHQNGIYSIYDKNCTSKTVGVMGEKQAIKR